MELSQEIQTILQKYRPQKAPPRSNDDYLINVENMNFDDETWLVGSNPVPDLQSFFKSDTAMMTSSDSETSNEIYKQFDSRTFTRPKRKVNRPSIEKYNAEYFPEMKIDKSQTLSEEIDNYMSISSTTLEDGMTEKPLPPVHFDLSQPINTSIFENIASHSMDLDSFQNMSPPSLVNSMCSSTFTNLMENSYIKNDPVLREIRDADYSSVIYQELEPPLYQSITESCSSINTEVAETFVRKTLNSLNCTFNKKLDETHSIKAQLHTENIDPNGTYTALNNTFNGTYRKNKSYDLNDTGIIGNDDGNSTFSVVQQPEMLNNTYRRSKSPKLNVLNSTYNKNLNEKENYSSPVLKFVPKSPKIDNYMLNEENEVFDNRTKRLSDEIDDYLNQKLSLYSDDNKDDVPHSAKSTDSLDRLSSISNSSRESKLMADVDAIVERQERSLQQVMSTPKHIKSKLFEPVQLSPIPNLNLKEKEHLSDSEVSSGEYSTVRSRFSEQNSARSLNNLKSVDAITRKCVHTITDMPARPATGLRRPSTAGRTSNLGTMGRGLRKEIKITGSYGNLRQLSSNLGSSYTNLRPKSMLLPNITSRGDGDMADFKVPQVPLKAGPISSEHNETFVKPKTTNLPRPSTGIPRPASRIPGPRTSRLPMSRAMASSRTNLNDGNY